MQLHDITLFVYNATLIPITFFSLLLIFFSMLNLLSRKRKQYKLQGDLPFISVQVPAYNDPIGARCIEHCLRFDYPRDKYEIIIADDSTNVQTQRLLKQFALDNPGFVKYIHRKNREGYKPGALKNAMKITNGEIIVLFDADWMPSPEFLKRVVRPFADPNVAIVQTRQGFYNHEKNLITRFAAYTLMIYHTIMMPLNNSANCVFFCGTAGAIRRKAFEDAGGWNIDSITEDADLSVRLLMKQYKTVYLDYETPSEVPETFEGFIKQQMRWTYGNARVFLDHVPELTYKRGLTWSQKFLIWYITLGCMIAPVVVLMTLAGFAGWFVGDPSVFTSKDLILMIMRFLLTGGFLLVGAVTLYKNNRMKEFKYLALSSFTVGILLAITTSIALFKAFLNQKLSWFCTPKTDNARMVDE